LITIENKKASNGLNVLGYVVPWWAVLLVVLVILYFAYEKGYFVELFGVNAAPRKEISLAGPIKQVIPIATPDNVQQIKRMSFGRTNSW